MSKPNQCPDVHTLRNFVTGRLRLERARDVVDHLVGCVHCRGVVDGLEATHRDPTRAGESAWTEPDLDPTASALLEADEVVPPDFDLEAILLPPTKPDTIGRIGAYHVLGVLGHGGMGIVLKAEDEALHRLVAIKVLMPSRLTSLGARRRFEREARAAAAINHSNVVIIYGVGEQNGAPYLVMELISGQSLRQRIRSGPPLTRAELFRIAVQITEGLAAAHDHGVIHRDIKPANIMLERGVERVKITDFGLALAALDASDVTSLNQVVGTPAYMSPEQVRGERADARSDLFGLGCVFYAMVAGASPFQGAHTLDVIRRVSDHQPPPLREICPNAGVAFSNIVEKLLSKNPANRYATAAEVASVLKEQLALLNLADSAEASKTLIIPGKKAPALPQRSWVSMLLLTAALFLIAAAVLLVRIALPEGSLRLPLPYVDRVVPSILTVSRVEPADYGTINAALADAHPGTTIRLLDDSTYEEAVTIADPAA